MWYEVQEQHNILDPRIQLPHFFPLTIEFCFVFWLGDNHPELQGWKKNLLDPITCVIHYLNLTKFKGFTFSFKQTDDQ